MEAALVETPYYTVQTSANPSPVQGAGKWLRIDFTFGVNSERQILNEVQFKVYVEVDDLQLPTDREGTPAVLTGDTTYINLPNKKDHHGAFFIHPYTVKRFGGESAFNFHEKKNIHVEAYVDGQLIASKDAHDDDPNWVGPLKKIGGMIMPREMSPWVFVDIDRYPPVKIRTANQ